MDESLREPGLREAALDAEFESGRREESEAQARAAIHVRVARMSVAVAIIIAGIILLPLPGPGLVVIAFGLAILAKDVPWARRVQQRVHSRIPRDQNGDVPKWVVVLGVLLFVIAVGASVTFTVARL